MFRFRSPHILTASVCGVAFGLAVAVRIRGIGSHFWMLQDQIRDWSIALGPFGDLPLVGPPTHVHGYTIGPAFYWILWAIRVTFGPWFENLPHGGGIGQAVLHSAADTLLLVAVWRRTGSLSIALGATMLIVTAAYDLCFAAIVWNPVFGTILSKVAIALVLLGAARGSVTRAAITAAVAWAAVHAYTGAIYVAVGVFVALLADPAWRRDWIGIRRNAIAIAISVALLQVPYAIHQIAHRFNEPAMGAVTGSVTQILTGSARPEIAKSINGFVAAFSFIQIRPWDSAWPLWVLAAAALVVAVQWRRDPALLAVILLPQILAVPGYALFLASLGNYYYLSLIPASILTIAFAIAALPFRWLVHGGGIAMLALAIWILPNRLDYAASLHRMPEYKPLVEGSRRVARRGQPMRQIVADFPLPPTANSEFVYTILGGRIDRQAPWIAVIEPDGGVTYRRVAP